MTKFRNSLFILVGLVLFCGSLAAQVPTGSRIIGIITDEEGLPLPGVTVETSSPKLVGVVSTISDENGAYRLLALPAGGYTITFSLTGFKTVVRKGVILDVEQTLKLDITLPLGTLEEQITVIGESPLVDVKSTVKGMVLNKTMFQILPRGRDFSTLVTAIPGVQNEPGLGGISVDGASGAENMFYVDGMDTTHVAGGEQAQDANFDFVEEVQIKASGYQAEFGGSLGGVINVITRSGGNEFHGGINFYYSGSALNGKERDNLRRNPITLDAEYVNYQDMYGKDKVTRFEPGFELGGYLLRDRIWFYGNIMPIFRDTTRSVEFLSGEKGDYDQDERWWNASAKLSVQPFKNLRMSFGFVNNWRNERKSLPPRDGTGNYAYDWGKTGFDYPNFTVTGNADLTVGNNLLISARGGWFRSDVTNPQVVPEERQIRFYYRAGSLDAYGFPEDKRKPYGWRNTRDLYALTKRMYQRLAAYGDVNYFFSLGGEHSVKAGGSFVRVSNDLAEGSLFPLIMIYVGYTYETYTGEEYIGKYGYYRSYYPLGFPAYAKNHSDRIALYLQDSWTIKERLTLNFGVRAETEYIPVFSDDPKYANTRPIDFKFGDKLAPRLGFVYDVFGDSSLKVFGSFGMFYDVMKMSLAEGLYGGDKYIVSYYTLDTMDWEQIGTGSAPNFNLPGTKVDRLDWRIPSIENTDPNLKPMTQSETSFGLEKQLTENLALSARFVYKHLIYGIEDIGFMTAEGETYLIGNPGFGTSSVADPKYPRCPKAKRDYHALNLSVTKRFSDNWFGGISYTWSRLWGNYCGLNSADEWGRNDPNTNRYWDYWFLMLDQNLNDAVGLLPTDRPHFLKVFGSYVFPFGLTVGTVVNAFSGIPFTTEVNVNNQQGYYPNGRFDTGKRTPFMFYSNLYAEYNLRIGDRYKIQFNVNVDNVWNADTARRLWPEYNVDQPYLTDDEILAGADYKQYCKQLDPRYGMDYDFLDATSVRLGLRLIF